MRLFKWLELLMLVATTTAEWEAITEKNKPRALTCLKFQGPLAYVDCRTTFHIKPENEKFKFKVPNKCDGDISVAINDVSTSPIRAIEKPLEIIISMDGGITFDDSSRKTKKLDDNIVIDESGLVKLYVGNMDDCKLEILAGTPMFDNPNSTAVKKPGMATGHLAGIIGGALGGIVVMGLVAGVLYYYCYKKDKDREERDLAAEKVREKRSKEAKEAAAKADKDGEKELACKKWLAVSRSTKERQDKEKLDKKDKDKKAKKQEEDAVLKDEEAKKTAAKAQAEQQEKDRFEALTTATAAPPANQQKPVEEQKKAADEKKPADAAKSGKDKPPADKPKSLDVQKTQNETLEAKQQPPKAGVEAKAPAAAPAAAPAPVHVAVVPPNKLATAYGTVAPSWENHRMDRYLKGGHFVVKAKFENTYFYSHTGNPVMLQARKFYSLCKTVEETELFKKVLERQHLPVYKYLWGAPNCPELTASDWIAMRAKHREVFSTVGPPETRDDDVNDLIAMDSIHHYLYNIGVFDVPQREACSYLDWCYQAYMCFDEWRFLCCGHVEGLNDFAKICKKAAKKYESALRMADHTPQELYTLMDEEQWGFFDRLYYFYHQNKSLFDGFKICPAHCSRLPLQGLLVLGVREQLNKGDSLRLVWKWFKMASLSILRRWDLRNMKQRIHYPILPMMFIWYDHDFSHVDPEIAVYLRKFLVDDVPIPNDWSCM